MPPRRTARLGHASHVTTAGQGPRCGVLPTAGSLCHVMPRHFARHPTCSRLAPVSVSFRHLRHERRRPVSAERRGCAAWAPIASEGPSPAVPLLLSQCRNVCHSSCAAGLHIQNLDPGLCATPHTSQHITPLAPRSSTWAVQSMLGGCWRRGGRRGRGQLWACAGLSGWTGWWKQGAECWPLRAPGLIGRVGNHRGPHLVLRPGLPSAAHGRSTGHAA